MTAALHIIIQYCNAADPARQREYDFCVRQNLANPHVASIHNLVEPGTWVPDEFRRHPKYRERTVDRWLTYEAAFQYANAVIGDRAVCCLCNLDIFLDRESDWDGASALVSGDERIVLCLARHEFDGVGQARMDENLARAGMANAQDAWVFATPIAVDNCNFEIGLPGCDNAIAHRIKRSGCLPLNAPTRYRIIHYDLCNRNPAQRWQGQASKVANKHPEREGQFLVPAMEQVQSLDRLMEQLKVPPLRRYEIACEIVSRYVKVVAP